MQEEVSTHGFINISLPPLAECCREWRIYLGDIYDRAKVGPHPYRHAVLSITRTFFWPQPQGKVEDRAVRVKDEWRLLHRG